MDSSVYIPKWLIAAFVACVGCVAGWMLGAADLVMASFGSPDPTADGGAPAEAAAAPDVPEEAAADPSRPQAASTGTPQPAVSPAASTRPPVALEGAASTVNSTVRITSTPGGQRGEATTPNSGVQIVSTPDGHRGEATTTNSRVGINAVVGGSSANGAASPASSPASASGAASPAGSSGSADGAASPASSPASAADRPAPTGAPASSAARGVVAPAGANVAAAPASRAATSPSSPVTGLGDWGPPGPLPPLVSPPLFAENLWNPLPGATSRGVAFSEWESYRTDVAGRNILVTTDDSNFLRDRNGKINANTGDIDASGFNVIDSTDSVIRGSESADEAPWQTMAAALVDLSGDGNGATPPDEDEQDDEEDEDNEDEEISDELVQVEPNGDALARAVGAIGTQPTQATQASPPTSPVATAAVVPPASTGTDDDDDDGEEGFDFPYESWVEHASADHATGVHTDEGTTLASGSDAIVIGADGYDDDDNRAVGENITITRDDGNVVIGGIGDVNAQIGDAEQGGLVMDVNRTMVQGGGAY
jgi:hypothetical protein